MALQPLQPMTTQLSPCMKSISLGVAVLALLAPAAAAVYKVDNVAVQCLERRTGVYINTHTFET